MPIKIQKIINVTMLLLSWSTIPFLGLQNIKRFLVSSILICVLEGLNANIGKRRKWWVFYNKPNSYLFNEFPFNIGPFFVGALWILKWSYGNFKQFALLNALFNAFFAFPFLYFSKKVKYFTLVRLSHIHFFLYFFTKSFLFYLLQLILDKVYFKLYKIQDDDNVELLDQENSNLC